MAIKIQTYPSGKGVITINRGNIGSILDISTKNRNETKFTLVCVDKTTYSRSRVVNKK